MWQECNPGDSHAPLSKEQEPFTGEPVPADRAENSRQAPNLKDKMKKSMSWMATSLVLVVLFGFVVLGCWARVQKGREPDFNTVVCFLKC